MTHNGAHQQNIEWLKEQLAQQESKLAKAEALVVQLRASVAHFRGVLEVVASNQAKLTPIEALIEEEVAILNKSQIISNAFAEDESLNGDQTANVVFEDYKSFEDESQSNPQSMKRPEHLDTTFAEAAQMILDKHQKSQELKSILTRARHSF